jgi:hypothetical protein
MFVGANWLIGIGCASARGVIPSTPIDAMAATTIARGIPELRALLM